MSQFESHEYEDTEYGEYGEQADEAYEGVESSGEFESYAADRTSELNEGFELELAQELLEVTSEQELEEFLGKLVSRVAKGAGSFLKSGVGKAIGGVVKGVIKAGLPLAGSAIGSFIAPGLGTAIGGKLGSMASKLLEAEELEAMEESEAEFEAARRYVRWAAGTVRHGLRAPRGAPPRAVARAAAISSARRYAPRLLHPSSPASRTWRDRRGRPGGRGRYGSHSRYGYPWYADQQPVSGTTGRDCVCGASAPDVDSDDGQDPGSFEVMEAFAAQPQHREKGRWYRRDGRIVVVGV